MGSIEHLEFSADPTGAIITIGHDTYGRPENVAVDMAEIEAALAYIRLMKLDKAYCQNVGVLDESQWRELAAAVVAAQWRLADRDAARATDRADTAVAEAHEQLAAGWTPDQVAGVLADAASVVADLRAGVTP